MVLRDDTAVERLVRVADRVLRVVCMLVSAAALDVSVLLNELTAVERALTFVLSALRLPMMSLNWAVDMPLVVTVTVLVYVNDAVAEAGVEVVP